MDFKIGSKIGNRGFEGTHQRGVFQYRNVFNDKKIEINVHAVGFWNDATSIIKNCERYFYFKSNIK